MWSTVKSPAGDACVAPTRRRSIRLRDYDYTTGGAYFITMCTRNRECLFGSVIDGNVLLNELGEIAASCWNAITEHFPDVEVDRFVVMPNHIHGILVIHAVGATHASPLRLGLPRRAGRIRVRWAQSLALSSPRWRLASTNHEEDRVSQSGNGITMSTLLEAKASWVESGSM